MKPLVLTNQTESALAKVARVGMVHVDLETVEAAALEVWYGSVVPDLEDVKGPHKKEALFLLERLTNYNLVPLSGNFMDFQQPVVRN